MEAKFFSEIEKNMDVETLKEFEKEVRTKIIAELEILRNKNKDLSRVLMGGKCDMWEKIRRGDYSWLKIKSGERKKRLFRLIDIYLKCNSIVDTVQELKEKVEKVKKMKNAPVDSE